MARDAYEVINAALSKDNFDWNRARETQATSKRAVILFCCSFELALAA